ncbi:MAG TPA: DUF3631 domain-containing protein [Candidatus Angelobacter sp.]|nr:DUF3631 domain-containing protein [Candidatus Angelobacter sp.]
MPPSKSTWTWTVIRTPGIHLPDYYHLPCSPQGELLLLKELVGKSFTIWAEDAPLAQLAEPNPSEIEEARSLIQVQLDPKHYTAAYTLPGGEPQVPPALASTHHALQKSDGSWWFLPKTNSLVGEASRPSSTVARKSVTQNREAQKLDLEVSTEGLALEVSTEPSLRCEPKELALKAPAEEPEPVVKKAEVVNDPEMLEEPAEPKRKPKKVKPVEKTKARNPNYGNSGDSGNPNFPTSSADTMDDIEELIHDHLVCSDAQGSILALWILHTYTYRASYLTPYLNISSPVEESGKSTCMTMLRALCARPWWAAGISPSAFKHKFMEDQPTVLLDNWHTIFRGSDKQQITGFLLSGCDRSRDVGSIQPNSEGVLSADGLETFCPKAFAGLDSLPPTLARRSIPIVLQRRKPQQAVKAAIHLLVPHNTRKLTSWMQSWSQDKDRLDQISNNFEKYGCQTSLLPGFSPHQQDCSRVLIALADTIGGHWPQKARSALLEIFREQQDREVSPIQLLSDIRDAFAHHHNPERIFTAELLEYLHSLDHRTWHEWNKNGDSMTAHALSRLLRKSFNIYSRSQRRGEKKLRGYQQSDFIEAWERYLPAPHTEATGENAVKDTAGNPAAESTEKERTGSQDNPPRKLPNYQLNHSPNSSISPNKINPCLNVPIQNSKLEITGYKSKNSPVSYFKAGCEKAWTKSSSLMKQFTAKASGMFTTTRS